MCWCPPGMVMKRIGLALNGIKRREWRIGDSGFSPLCSLGAFLSVMCARTSWHNKSTPPVSQTMGSFFLSEYLLASR